MNVLVTGGNGRIGTAVRRRLADREGYSLTILDVKNRPGVDTVLANVTEYEELHPAVEGQDAVVHLAADPSPDAPWERIHPLNVVGTYNVLEAAREAGVERVVFASSNLVGAGHADFYEGDLEPGHDLSVDRWTEPRPDSLYAVSKLFGEHLGRYYADYEPAPERFYAGRFGWVLEPEYDAPWGGAERGADRGEFERDSEAYDLHVEAGRRLWCSRRDAAQFVELALADETVTYDVFGVRSAGDRQWLGVDRTRDVLGFDPADDADEGEPPA